MTLFRSRYFAIFLLLLAFSAGAWKLTSSGAVPEANDLQAPQTAQTAPEKAPGLSAPVAPSTSAARPQERTVDAPVALVPTALPTSTRTPAPSQPYRVALQIGHYKISEMPAALSRLSGDTGTSGGGRKEVDLNFEMTNRIAALLRAQGIIVDILPATVPSGYTADAFIAIHADGNPSATPRGFKISTRWGSPIAWQDTRLVEILTSSYGAATGLPEDGNVTKNMRGYYAYASWRPNYRISNFTPGAIVEMGYMSNPADRAVMFNSPGKVASGIASGIVSFLKESYGSPRVTHTYGYGVTDPSIDIHAPWGPESPNPPSQTQDRSRPVTGNWQMLLMGKPQLNVYSDPGGGRVVAQLLHDHFYHSTLRKGDYYRLDLPGGGTGWINRNYVVLQR